MKKITTIPAMIAVIATLSISLIVGLVFNIVDSNETIENPFELVPDISNTSSIEIRSASENISLYRDKSDWKIKSETGQVYPVRLERVVDFFSSLKGIKVQSIVANSDVSRAEVGLKAENTLSLKIVDTQNRVSDFEFSDSLNDRGLQLMAKKGDSKVLSIDSGLISYLKQNTQYWLDRRLWPDLDPKTGVLSFAIERFSARSSTTRSFTSSVVNGNTLWQAKQNSSKTSEEIAGYVNDISRIEGDEFFDLEKVPVPNYQKLFNLTMKFADGRERVLVVYKSKDTEQYIAAPLADLSEKTANLLVFQVSAWKLKLSMLE